MIVAAHQPHYLPWLGYLHKLAKADVFVVMDDLQYEAQNFQNRQRIKQHSGAAWLTIPLERGAQDDRILDKRIDNSGSARQHWQRRHWLTLENNYRRAPHFDRYAGPLHALYVKPWTSLVELDLCMLAFAQKSLGIRTPIIRSSWLGLVGHKTDRLIDMCQKLGAHAYLSGRGGSSDYLDVEQMGRAGIDVIWQHFDHPVYPQRHPERGFTSHLGFLDLLFNCGEASANLVLDRGHPTRAISTAATPSHQEAV